MTEQTARRPNYFEDIEKYGKRGEALFEAMIKPYNYVNVTEVKPFQAADIDFLIDNHELLKPGDKLSITPILREPRIQKVEVKVDITASQTGNLPFELVSHKHVGWSACTKADSIATIIAREDLNTGRMFADELLLLDMKNWKKFITENFHMCRLNIIVDENIYDILCPIQALNDCGVIIERHWLGGVEF